MKFQMIPFAVILFPMNKGDRKSKPFAEINFPPAGQFCVARLTKITNFSMAHKNTTTRDPQNRGFLLCTAEKP